jgi:hypothetical protein
MTRTLERDMDLLHAGQSLNVVIRALAVFVAVERFGPHSQAKPPSALCPASGGA